MKKLASVCLLTLCLSVPVFAGHTVPGGYCSPCGVPGCFCDPGEEPLNGLASQPSKQETATDFGSGALVILAVLLIALRYKA